MFNTVLLFLFLRLFFEPLPIAATNDGASTTLQAISEVSRGNQIGTMR